MSNCFKNVSVWRQALATFAAAIGMFNWGNLIGWSNAADLQLRHNETGFGMNDEEGSWVGSTIGFGGIVGSIFAGKLMDIIGRNSSLIFAYTLSLVGWITIACASSIWIICIGRFICGMAAATTALTASVYVGEVVASKHRGMFGCALAFAQSIGLQYVVVAGEITPNWRITTVACIVPIAIGILILFLVPESPYFLAWKNDSVEASRKSIVWILGNTDEKVENFMGDINEYLQTMRKSIDSGIEISYYQNQAFQMEQDPNANQNMPALTKDEQPKRRQSIFNENSHSIEEMKMITLFDIKMILIGSAAMMFSKVCGDPALDYYMVKIFHTTGMDLKPSWATIVVRLAEILSTALSLYLTDRMGRKVLLLGSAIGMAVAMCILGAGFTLMDQPGFSENPIPGVSYLPLVGMIVFYLVSPIGFNAIIFVLLGELYSPSIKGIATSVATIMWWLSEFVTAKLFFLWNENLGRAGTFYLYAATAVAAFFFVLIFIRETKNKTLAEIQELYKQKPIQGKGCCGVL